MGFRGTDASSIYNWAENLRATKTDFELPYPGPPYTSPLSPSTHPRASVPLFNSTPLTAPPLVSWHWKPIALLVG